MARSPCIPNIRIRPELTPSSEWSYSTDPGIFSSVSSSQWRPHHRPCPRSCPPVHRRIDGQSSIIRPFSLVFIPSKGTTITLDTKTGQRLEGVVVSTSGEGDTPGVALKDVKEISHPGAPLKTQLFIASTNIDNWTSGPADAKLTNGDCKFQLIELNKIYAF